MKNPIKFFTDKYYRNAEMVSYWKRQDTVEAKQMKLSDGSYVMQMKGEKYAFPGYPRGSLLFGGLSKLKHEIKNQIFNECWRRLEEGEDRETILTYLREVAWPQIFELGEKTKYDMVPFESLNMPIKELWRALTVIGCDSRLKEILCFIFQEDDAYRMRFQWLVKFFPRWRKPTSKDFARAMEMAEHAEMIGDMKERQRLFRRIFIFLTQDSEIFVRFLEEVNWRKMRLTKADKYFFRAKYFKVDYPEYTY